VTVSDSDGCTATRPLSLVVGDPQPAALVLSTSSSPAPGLPFQLVAKVEVPPGSPVPTGTITFTVDGVAQPPVPLIDGVASLTLTLSSGWHRVTARYSGDANYLAGSPVGQIASVGVAPIPMTGAAALCFMAVLLAAAGLVSLRT
jgi:hypothetical protein